MQKFKERWQIQKNWQILFPALGVVGAVFSGYKLTKAILDDSNLFLSLSVTLLLSYLIIKLCLYLFKKLEKKWVVKHRWEMIRIFLVFAVTGSTSVYVSRPIIKLIGITKENLNILAYWVLFILVSLICYQLLLVFFGWVSGQFQFFWAFEKKMLRRFGLGKFLNENT